MDDLTLAVLHGDGTETRWGPGEDDVGRIPNDLQCRSTSPGGNESLTTSVLRDIQPQSDESLLDTVVLYGPGGQIVWEGLWQALPRETGDANRMTATAVGFATMLGYNKSFREIYVDRDMSNWGSPSLNRRILIATAGANFIDGASASDLTWDIPDTLPSGDYTERVYPCPAGIKIANVMYRGARTGAFTNFEAPTLFGAASDDLSSADSYSLTLDDTLRLQSLTTAARRYIMLRTKTNAAVTPGGGHQQRYTKIAVYGNHGLTTHAIPGEPDGIYASDIINDVVSRAAPLLNRDITPTTDPIPQAAYPQFTTADAVIADVNKYHAWDWLVYDNRTFIYRPAGSGTQWRARRADGARLRLDGETSDVILNRIYVEYTDGFGQSKTAGPVGSGCDVEDSSLEDATTTNPVNSHGIADKSDVLRLSQPTTDAGAVVIGALALYEANVATRRGQITLTGSVEHPTEGKVPVWRVRAGDTITVTDLEGDVSRRIIDVTYQHSTRTATLSLDNTPPVMEAIVARLATAIGGIR